MFETVDSLIEMAMDFSEFDVRDPHDPEFHKSMVGQRVIVYVPITTDMFWEVVEGGIQTSGLFKDQDRRSATIFLSQSEASDRAHSMAYEKNRAHNGPIKPMVIVAEKKVTKPVKSDDILADISFKAGAVKAHMVDAMITPKDIIAVNYPAEAHSWDIPIREFIRNAKYGQYDPEIPGKKVSGMKFGKATPPPWQYVVLRRVQDLLNYSSNYYNYLVNEFAHDLNTVVIREATKLGLHKMWYWTNKDFMEWIYQILPPTDPESETTKEDDIASVLHATAHEGGGRPLYQVFDKYKDELAYEVRAGKKPAPTRNE